MAATMKQKQVALETKQDKALARMRNEQQRAQEEERART